MLSGLDDKEVIESAQVTDRYEYLMYCNWINIGGVNDAEDVCLLPTSLLQLGITCIFLQVIPMTESNW